jgi:hypothetical protein
MLHNLNIQIANLTHSEIGIFEISTLSMTSPYFSYTVIHSFQHDVMIYTTNIRTTSRYCQANDALTATSPDNTIVWLVANTHTRPCAHTHLHAQTLTQLNKRTYYYVCIRTLQPFSLSLSLSLSLSHTRACVRIFTQSILQSLIKS